MTLDEAIQHYMEEFFQDEGVAKKWATATENTRALENAYRQGYYEGYHGALLKQCNDTINRQVVLDKIEEVCFSKEKKWVDFRTSYGSRGQIDLIIKFIESLPNESER